MFGITSEPQSLATEAEEDWEMGFPVIGDPHHEIREVCQARGWLDVFFNEDCGHLGRRPWASHPKGYYQPAVLAVTQEGRVLYRWRCVPKYTNISGAGARPEAVYTWNKMQDTMQDSTDAEPDRDPTLGAEDLSWFRFLLIMVAHGWFLRPKAFPLARPDDPRRVSPRFMMRRVYGFLAVWAVALVSLPAQWVAGAALVWVAVLTPGIIAIHRQFQNEPDAY